MPRTNEAKGFTLGVILLYLGNILVFYFLLGLLHLIAVTNTSISNQIYNYLTIGRRFFYIVFSPALTQLIYVVPACYWLKLKERIAVMEGVIFGAVITALLNGVCWLLIMPK